MVAPAGGRSTRLRRVLGMVGICGLLAAGCGTDGQADAGATAEEATPGRVDADLVIWTDGESAPPLQEFADSFSERYDVRVAVQQVPGTQLRSQFQLAAPAGEGPDLIQGPHDWIGELAANGVLAPVDLGPVAEDFVPVSIEAFTLGGLLYGMPALIENIALYRNTDLVPEAPETFEELEEIALRLQESGEADYGLLIPATEAEAPYFNQAFLRAYGGYIFEQNEAGEYNTAEVGLDSDGSLEAANAFRRWVDSGLFNPSMTGSLMQEIFGAGRAAFAISGPWSLIQGGQGFRETGVPYEVSPIPPVEGEPAEPFVGVRGFMQSSFSDNPLLARTFLLESIATEEAQLVLAETLARPPALQSAYDTFTEDPDYAAFGESGENGNPMPAIPEMASVFTAMGQAYTLIYQGQSEPESAFRNAAQQVRSVTGGE
jgi:arabinogalactan oligomer / maltooligosaccharide transport system substrate-binding protein